MFDWERVQLWRLGVAKPGHFFLRHKSLFVNYVQSIILVCTGACVYVYAPRVVSPDGILHNKDSLIIITNDIKSILYDFSRSAERKSPATKYLKTRAGGGRGGGVKKRESSIMQRLQNFTHTSSQ